MILPLWAVSIGVSATNTALIIGIAGAVDFALFYFGGWIMDRYGRLASALPSMIGLGAGHLLLSFTHDLPSNVAWFIAAAMVLSVANGLGSGILMTLGVRPRGQAQPGAVPGRVATHPRDRQRQRPVAHRGIAIRLARPCPRPSWDAPMSARRLLRALCPLHPPPAASPRPGPNR